MKGNPHQKRTTPVKRLPHKESHNPLHFEELLTRSRVAHIAIDDGGPIIIPVGCAPSLDRKEIFLHGSSASRLFSKLQAGVEACLTLTILEGLVLARSAFESSMHYKSLIAFGRARNLEGEEKIAALDLLVEHLLPGRSQELRPSTTQELKATALVAFPLDDYAIKVSAADPEDKPEDLDARIWAGVIPIHESFGQPQPAKNLDPSISLPDYIKNWKTK